MKTYDEVVAGVLEGAAAHRRKVKRMQKIASLTAMCAVCVVGLSVYMNLEPRQSLPADSGSDILTETQPYLHHDPSEHEDPAVQDSTAQVQEQLPTDSIVTEPESIPQTEPTVFPPQATEPENVQNGTDPISTEPPATDPVETQEVQTAPPPTPTDPPATIPIVTEPVVIQTEPHTDTMDPTEGEDIETTRYNDGDVGDYPQDDPPTGDTDPTETTETTTTAPLSHTSTITVTTAAVNAEASEPQLPDPPKILKCDLPYCRRSQKD